jgi:hypothetical protein
MNNFLYFTFGLIKMALPDNTVLSNNNNSVSFGVAIRSVKRANETIGIKPKSGKLTLLSRRLFHMLIYFIQQDGNKEIYRRSLSSFVKNIEYGSKDTSLLKETLVSLMNVTVEWNSDVFDTEEDRVWNSDTTSNLVAEVAILEKGRGHEVFVEWSFPPKLRERLLDPIFYTRFQHHCLDLRASSSLALFEQVERYKTNPGGKTNKNAWEWWVDRLTGSSAERYEYKYFKRDVLRLAMAEINSCVDEYDIELIEHKESGGRKVTSIQFQIHKKVQQSLAIAAPSPINTDLIGKIVDLGIQTNEATDMFHNYEENLIIKTLDMTYNRARNTLLPALQSKAAYFKRALVEGYVTVIEVPKKKIKSNKSMLDVPTKEEKYSVLYQKRALDYFENLSESQKESFVNNYFNENDVDVVKSEYKKKQFKSTLFKNAFFSWLAVHLWGPADTEENDGFTSEEF